MVIASSQLRIGYLARMEIFYGFALEGEFGG
jgi:hypothetical protein